MPDDSGLSTGAWTLIAIVIALLVLATIVGAIVLSVKVWRMRQKLGELGAGGKVAFYGALIYTIFPVDLLPDPVYLDDMGVLTGALMYLTKLAAKRREEAERYGPQLRASDPGAGRGSSRAR